MRHPAALWRLPMAALLLCALPCAARVGETYEQLVARFGKPTFVVAKPRAPAEAEYSFGKSGLAVHVSMRQGRCALIRYSRLTGKLTEDEVQQLLRANGDEWIPETKPEWDIVKNRRAAKMWRRSDNVAWAELNLYGENTLSVMMFEWLEAEAKAAATPPPPKKPNLQGF